ncbi:MAG: addiction module protein [Planctomycetia bacterium]
MAKLMEELGLDRLGAEDRLRLFNELRDSLTPDENASLPDWHAEEIDRRLADAEKNPDDVHPWEEVKARLLGGS